MTLTRALHSLYNGKAMQRFLSAILFLAAWATAGTNASAPAEKKKESVAKTSAASGGTDAEELTVDENGLQLGSAVVIEGRVEKPQVQFPLLREPPPLREIRFEESFLRNILKLDRENVPDPKTSAAAGK
jgi:hypothetical protein